MEDKTIESKPSKAIPGNSAVIAILCAGCVILGLTLIYVVSITTCDGIALDLNQVYESKGTDLHVEFTELIKANTEILEE